MQQFTSFAALGDFKGRYVTVLLCPYFFSYKAKQFWIVMIR